MMTMTNLKYYDSTYCKCRSKVYNADVYKERIK